MREAIGSSLLFNLVITIVIVMIAVLISSLAYSKAFKVKNKIINIIQDNGSYEDSVDSINSSLSNMGYRTDNASCSKKDGMELLTDSNSNYFYCVYEIDSNNKNATYYKVVTYMYFDIPIIGKLLKFPVSGETKLIYNEFPNYED